LQGKDLGDRIRAQRRRWRLVGLCLFVSLILSMLLALSVGAVKLSPKNVWQALFAQSPDTARTIVWQLRLPRILMAAVVGTALSGSGVALQGLFRNSLVDPYILGLSSGAALGAALGLTLNLASLIPLFAFLGALLATTISYLLARENGRVPPMRLLLAGVATSAFLSALVSMLMLKSQRSLQSIFLWLMGSFSGRSWPELKLVLPYMLLGLCLIFLHLRELNLLLLGEEAAGQLGIEVERAKRFLLLGATLAAAASVAGSGTIGFVGLVVPHLVRILTGSDHRLLFPLSLLTGALFMVLADTIARTIMAPVELPVGIITSLVGAPFFLYLLQKGGRKWQ
jgi:iron complex transport system permease protein